LSIPKMKYNAPMSLKATAAYLKLLRENAGISQAELARRTHTSSSQINRLEDAKGEVRASLMASIVRALNASAEDVITLLVDSSATAESGQKLAMNWLEKRKAEPQTRHHVHPEILALASRMTEFQLGKWVAMGERLIDE